MNKITSFASSSSGNCYLYSVGNKNILVDFGITNKNFNEKAIEIDFDLSLIDAVFITHEHIDHIKGLKVFFNKYDVPLFITKETYENLGFVIKNPNFVNAGETIDLFNIKIQIIKISHDAINPIGFIFHTDTKKIVHITDTGYINAKNRSLLKDADAYLIESNYDYNMLISNDKYPFNTKKRILSDNGHLSNTQCNEYLEELISKNTKYILFAHISQNNNDREIIEKLNDQIKVKNKIILEKDALVEVKFEW